MPPRISSLLIKPSDKPPLLGYLDARVNDELAIRGIKLVKGSERVFLDMPTREASSLSSCGHENAMHAKFCTCCGEDLYKIAATPASHKNHDLHVCVCHPITPEVRTQWESTVQEGMRAAHRFIKETCGEARRTMQSILVSFGEDGGSRAEAHDPGRRKQSQSSAFPTLRVTNVEIAPLLTPRNGYRAHANITLDDALVVQGLRIRDGGDDGHQSTDMPMQARKVRCHSCGGKNAVQACFCGHCGTPIDRKAAQASLNGAKEVMELAHPITARLRHHVETILRDAERLARGYPDPPQASDGDPCFTFHPPSKDAPMSVRPMAQWHVANFKRHFPLTRMPRK